MIAAPKEKGRPKGGYSNERKSQYRDRVYDYAVSKIPDVKTAIALILPSVEGDEIAKAIEMGFLEENIYAAEIDKSNASKFTWLQKYPKVHLTIGDVSKAAKKIAKCKKTIGFLNLDFCGPVSSKMIACLSRIAASGALVEDSVVSITTMVGREAPSVIELLAGQASLTVAGRRDWKLKRAELAVRAMLLHFPHAYRASDPESFSYSSSKAYLAVAMFQLKEPPGFRKASVPIGLKSGRLTVSGPAPDRIRPDGKRAQCVTVTCECGIAKPITLATLKYAKVKSCGCLAKEIGREVGKARRKAWIGKTFGVLTVLGDAPSIIRGGGKYDTQVLVRCNACGQEKVLQSRRLYRKNPKSCGADCDLARPGLTRGQSIHDLTRYVGCTFKGVIVREILKPKNGRSMCLVECAACGKMKSARLEHVLSMRVRCGWKCPKRPKSSRAGTQSDTTRAVLQIVAEMRPSASWSVISDALNERGYRTRFGTEWTPKSIIEQARGAANRSVLTPIRPRGTLRGATSPLTEST